VVFGKGPLVKSQVQASDSESSKNLSGILSREEGSLDDDGFSSDSQDISLVGAEATKPDVTTGTRTGSELRTHRFSNLSHIPVVPELHGSAIQRLLVPTAIAPDPAEEGHPTIKMTKSIPVAKSLLKRTESMKTKKSSDTEGEAPARKRASGDVVLQSNSTDFGRASNEIEESTNTALCSDKVFPGGVK
jgi:hypothetical protein